MIGHVRSMGRIALMAALLLACVPLFYLWRPFTRQNPWPRRFLAGIARIAGIRTRCVGVAPRRNAFLLANHVSWIDIPALAGATGAAFVAHDGLTGHPVLHWLCRMNDTVFVARHDRRSVARQVEQVREAISDTGALAIFPEGTTGDGVQLLPFKSSLLSALSPLPPEMVVQPVWLDYGREVPEIAWIGEEHGLTNFLRILSRPRPLSLTLHFLEPLAGNELADRKAIALAAQSAIGRAMTAH